MRPSDYCFKKGAQNSYIIKKTNSRRMALNLDEIKKNADASIGEKEKNRRMSRDLFLFSFWANGLNFTDLVRLKWSDFNSKTNEFTCTYTARHSFGTILAHKRVPESYIGFALGHSRKSVTDSYIEEYSVEDRRQYNGMLQF